MRKNRPYVLVVALLGILGLALLLPGRPATAQQDAVAPVPTGPLLDDERNTIEIVNTRGPSVVAVNVEIRGTRVNPLDQVIPNLPPQFRDMFRVPSVPQVRQSSGSGFVVAPGELITNYHVVRAALEDDSVELRQGASLRVVFPGSEEELDARVVGANPDYDLALLALTDPGAFPADVEPLEIADSSFAQVGQKVIAIGNPFGLQSSVSQGIISAIGRELPSIGRVQIEMIQTDAAINPGNSGGPLLDSAGRLIGINTMIVPGVTAGGSAGNIGIGFAVPSELLIETLPSLREGGLTGVYALSLDIENRPRVGVQVIAVADYPRRAREVLDLPDTGLVVMSVAPDSPAERAGLRAYTFEANIDGNAFPAGGDIILTANGRALRQAADLQRLLIDAREGDELRLEVWNAGATREVTVTLEVVPVTPPQNQP